MKYFKPTSLTWWSGFVPFLAGLMVASEPMHGLSDIVQTINAITDNTPSAVLINAGVAAIALRAAIK